MKYRMHIAGPDDISDFPDELSALREANIINKLYVKRMGELTGKDREIEPMYVATVEAVDRCNND